MNDPNDYADVGPSAQQDPTAGLDRTVTIAAPSTQMWAPPAPIQYTAQSAGIPAYAYQGGPQGYDDSQAYMTQARASYGDLPMMGMRGAYTVGAGAMQGGANMFSAIGAQIAPISYTPPARVLTDYSGRYVQQTDMVSDVKNMLGLGTMMRSAHVADIRYNAASDMGEKVALAAAGAGLSLANIGIGVLGSYAGGAALGGVGAIAGGIAAPLAAAALAGDRIEQGVAQRRDIMNYLEATSDRYISAGNPLADPRRGAGLNAGARREVTEFIRGMDIKDPMLNTDELTKILKEGTQQGLFTGTRSMDDFKKRFKDVVDNVKLVATTLHQTLEEGVKTIHDMRAIGIDPARVAGVLGRVEAAGLASGRSAGEMLNLGLQGAEMFRGTGVSMQIGFESNIMNASSIRAARDAKFLSDEAIAQAGGEEALAQRMTASSLGFTQTQTGRGMMGMLFGAGLPGSGFNANAFGQMVSQGGGDLNANAMAAARNLSTPGALVKFQANQEQIASDLGKTFGGKGLDIFMDNAIMMQATNLAKVSGSSVEDAFKVIAKTQMGLSDTEAQARLAEIRSASQGFDSAQAGATAALQKTKEDQSAQNFFVTRVGAKIGAVVKEATDVVSRPIADTVENAKQKTAVLSDYLMGIQRVNLAGTGQDEYTPISTADAVGPSRTLARRETNIDRGGVLGLNAGVALANLIRTGKTGGLDLSPDESGEIILQGEAGLLGGRGGESVLLGETRGTRVSLAKLEEASKIARVTTTTLGEAREMQQAGKIDSELKSTHEAFLSKLGTAELDNVKDLPGLVTTVFGEGTKLKDLNKAHMAALLVETQNSPRLQGILDEARKAGEAVENANNAVTVSRQAGDIEKAEESRRGLNELLTPSGVTGAVSRFFTGRDEGSLTPAAMARLAEVNQLARTGATDEAMKAAKDAFTSEISKIGGEAGDKLSRRIPEFLDKAMSPDATRDRLFADYAANRADISAEQQRRGQALLSRSVSSDLYGGAASKLDVQDKAKIVDLMDRIGAEGVGAVRDIAKNKDDLALMSQTAAGQSIANEAKIISKLESVGEGKSRADVLGALKGMMPTGTGSVGEKIADAYAQHQSSSDAISAVHTQTMDEIAGKSNMASAGAVSSASGGPGGTADQQATVQLNINTAVRDALYALNAKLKGGQ